MKCYKRCFLGFDTFPDIFGQPGVLGHQQSVCRKDPNTQLIFRHNLFLSTFISQLAIFLQFEYFPFFFFPGTNVVQVHAVDRDADDDDGPNGRVTYSIVSPHNQYANAQVKKRLIFLEKKHHFLPEMFHLLKDTYCFWYVVFWEILSSDAVPSFPNGNIALCFFSRH